MVTAPATQPDVTAPPSAVFDTFNARDVDAARGFYSKYVDLQGLSILAGADVSDEALIRTHEIVSHLLAGRPDVLAEMKRVHTHLAIIGKDQVYTDLPEYRYEPNPAYVNERVRGTGGLDVTSFGEENLLNLPIDRYDDESIAVHEFFHTIDAALTHIDPEWRNRLTATYRNALDHGRWKRAYAGGNPDEYWAEIAQSYFDCNRVNNWNHTNVHSREQLRMYDPEGYELVRTTMRLTSANDWRYQPVRPQPSVVAPPARFKVDPYYTKFSYARELPIIASEQVNDIALLCANDTVRKLFAYRHDLLKALINDRSKLVILGRHERLSQLPELRSAASTQPAWDEARWMDYSSQSKVMVVPEENILHDSSDPAACESLVVKVLARAVFAIAARRPVDPSWDRRPPEIWQQYELHVDRLDERFGRTVDELLAKARAKKLWQGTSAQNDAESYWCAGVEAYFDAAGTGEPPLDADRPINTREILRTYDPDLFALVDKTFGYSGRVDWRFKPSN
ncbi:MAG: hypothetical protein QM770_14285 [Tepidisphaeraceae bacterium]